MITYPNSKINLGLKVLEKRKDGFHHLESVFLPVPWCDALEIIENKKVTSEKVVFSSSGLTIEGGIDNNLCVKAYHLLDAEFSLPPIKMHLHKIIPMGAGLGGGSSDGAFTLKLLNDLFHLKLSTTQLKKQAAKLGSDCSFFIHNTPSFATGRGEKLKSIRLPLSGVHLVILHPPIHINTTEAFKHILRSPYQYSLTALPDWNHKTWQKRIQNDFEGYAFSRYPSLRILKEELYRKGAFYASMSGSGSAIYGLFDSKIKIATSWNNLSVFQTTL